VGIIRTVQLVATLAFALPVGLLGVQFLLTGRTLFGIALVGVAVLMVVLEEYVTTPTDAPAEAAETVVGAVVKDEDSEQ
jgi:hypothetical protein